MELQYLVLSFLIILVGVILSKMSFKRRHLTTLVLSWLLFSYKLIEYTVYGLQLRLEKIPLEFSTITYFLFALTLIFNVRSLKTIAAFMAFITGLGYLITFGFLAEMFYQTNGFFVTTMALISHSVVYFGSMMMAKNIVWNHHEERKILVLLLVYIVYASAINMFMSFNQQFIFIRMLLGADILHQLLPMITYSSYIYLLYYLSIYLAFRVIMTLFQTLCNYVKRSEVQHEHTV